MNHNGWPQARSAIGAAQQQLAPLRRQVAAVHHGTQRIAQLSEDAKHQVAKAYSPMAATSPPWIPC